MKRLLFFMLLTAALACNAPIQAVTPTVGQPTVQPSVTLPPHPTATGLPATQQPPTAVPEPVTAYAEIQALLPQVDSDRLVSTITQLSAIETRHVNSPGTALAAEYIFAAFEELGVDVTYQSFPAAFGGLPTEQRNVIATLPGTDPQAGRIILAAHYDSRTVDFTDAQGRAPGANDNASGVAALIELARMLRTVEQRRTVVLIAVAGEEVGLLGSTHAAEQARTNAENIAVMVAVDTIGNARGAVGEGEIRVFSPGPVGSPSRWYARHGQLTASTYLEGFGVTVQDAQDRPGRYGDHYAYIDAGYPAIRYIEREEDLGNNHSAGDTVDRLSPGYLRDATQLMLAQTASLAFSTDAPTDLTRQGEVLSWAAVAGSSGYLVVVREGNAIVYQQVTAQTTLTLPTTLAREGYAVSVAAFSEAGALSPFAPEVSW